MTPCSRDRENTADSRCGYCGARPGWIHEGIPRGYAHVSAPTFVMWRCACGWSGPTWRLIPTPAGGLACPAPDCGSTGGLISHEPAPDGNDLSSGSGVAPAITGRVPPEPAHDRAAARCLTREDVERLRRCKPHVLAKFPPGVASPRPRPMQLERGDARLGEADDATIRDVGAQGALVVGDRHQSKRRGLGRPG